jgi:CheY-like chemotaxis protein
MGERLDGVRVLLVEDDDDLRLMLETFLAGEGAIVYAAPHATAAVDGLARFRPSVLVLDLKLPDTDGASLLAQLRARPEGASTPALLITGQPRAAAVELAHRAGFDAFLSKPMELSAVARSVAWLGKGRREPTG